MDPDWPQEDLDGPMTADCPPEPHYAPAWSSDGGHDQVSQAAGKSWGLAPWGPWQPGR